MKIKLLLSAVLLSSLGFAQTPRSIDEVYAPVIVGTPPCDAYIGLSQMPDGELRHYNYGENFDQKQPLYLTSRDSGLTWQTQYVTRDLPYADQRSPLSGEYIRIFCANKKVYAMRTEGGLEGGRTISVIDDTLGIMNKPPIFIRGGKRIISGAHRIDRSGAYVYYSDDDGRTWKHSATVNSPRHEKGGFHQGVRWNHGAVEPTIVELQDGRLWMIMRTALDRHYQSFSTDGGETWSPATPSPFYGTITMPTFQRLKDGRLLFFWCNTTPLPELPTATGVWDDVFTNRDAVHVAISDDDGKTWKGMRELLLNPERNTSAFGNTRPSEDKSVHQVQALEVKPGKMLVSVGQHRQCRKLMLFDVNWLYEPTRSCDFSNGLADWSVFQYYKGIVGHCCYNRREQAILTAHPDQPGKQALCLKTTPNDSLLQDNCGAVWNFPAAPNGFAKLRFKMPKGCAEVRLLLNDRWFNPTDTVAAYECMYTLPLTRKQLRVKDTEWHELSIHWSHNRPATYWVDGRRRGTLPLQHQTEHGISYLHFLGNSEPTAEGLYIDWVEAGKELM